LVLCYNLVMQKVRYNHLNTHLKNIFSERTLKICVDGGFTCPNRDGKVSFGGCVFCGEMGAGDNIYKKLNVQNFSQYNCSRCLDYAKNDELSDTCKQKLKSSIKSQVIGFLNSYRGQRANKFLVYFQSFSNTYDSVNNLKFRYDYALGLSDKIVGIEVATRPDCISEEIVELLASYKDKYYVCVELGLQVADDNIGNLLNRGYTTEQFKIACDILHKHNIPVVAHMMIGLPNETENSIMDTIRIINQCKCEGIKLHSTYVIENTRLQSMYNDGEYTPITQEYYVEMVAKIIGNLRHDIVVHRINADPPKEIFVAPEWVLKKKVVINSINKKLSDLDVIQGCYL